MGLQKEEQLSNSSVLIIFKIEKAIVFYKYIKESGSYILDSFDKRSTYDKRNNDAVF